MRPCSFEAGQKDFHRIKHPASPFRLAGESEAAVGMRSEDKCPTISNKHFVQQPKCKSNPAETPCPSVVGRHWQVLVKAWMCLVHPAIQPCLSPGVVLSRSGERKGTTTPSRLASTAGSLLYPPLPNTARAAPWDLTNPLLFWGPRVLAVLLIPPAPFFLWLFTLGYVGLCILSNFLQSCLLGPMGRFALLVCIFMPAPLPDPSEFQRLFCSPLIWKSLPALEKEQAFIPACASSSDLLTKLYM